MSGTKCIMVRSTQGIDIVNRAISLPKVLKSDDGRLFHISEWHTSTVKGDNVNISAQLSVSIEDQ